MNNSSKFKKVISFFMAILVTINVCVLPVWAYSNPAGEWDDGEWHDVYEDFSQCPNYLPDDLIYDGVTSENVTESFNIKKEYGLDWVTESDYYMSQPFCLRKRWNRGTVAGNVYLNFETNYANVKQLFQRSTFDDIAEAVKDRDLNVADYDVYYTLRTSYHPSREYGYLIMTYVFVPKGHRIAISNENSIDGDTDGIKYGLWLSNDDGLVGVLDTTYEQCWSYSIQYGTEGGAISKSFSQYKAAFLSWLGMAHLNLIATNIPIFHDAYNAKLWITTGNSKEDPTNKIPDEPTQDENRNNILSSDAFGWQSFDCSLVQDGSSYKFIYKYVPKTDDMKKNSSDYYFTCNYSQNVKYKVLGQTNDLYKSKSSNLSKDNALDSGGTTINTFKELGVKVYDGSDDGTAGSWFRFAINNLLGSDVVQGSADILSSYLYVTITLHHKRFETDNNALKPVEKMMNDVSSDVRHFKYDAITGKLLDSSDVTSDVVTKDLTDDDGNVITDSNGNPIKQVTQITTNDNSTHTTINNYYYDSDGKQSTSSDGSDTLSNILSTLIKFIKTLVTEGLPAALEILQTLITSLSNMISSALDGLNVGEGTTNGIIAVLKCIPASCWSLVVIGVIVLVVVGILKHIF